MLLLFDSQTDVLLVLKSVDNKTLGDISLQFLCCFAIIKQGLEKDGKQMYIYEISDKLLLWCDIRCSDCYTCTWKQWTKWCTGYRTIHCHSFVPLIWLFCFYSYLLRVRKWNQPSLGGANETHTIELSTAAASNLFAS